MKLALTRNTLFPFCTISPSRTTAKSFEGQVYDHVSRYWRARHPIDDWHGVSGLKMKWSVEKTMKNGSTPKT